MAFFPVLLSTIGVGLTFTVLMDPSNGLINNVIASVIYQQYQAGFYGLSTAGNVVLFILVTAIVFPLYRFFTRREVGL